MAIKNESTVDLPGLTEIDPSLFRQGDPWRLVVDLNELCNIQCSYCHIDSLWGKAAKNARTLSPDVVGKVLTAADDMEVFDATLTGGEITTMPNFSSYLDLVRDLNFTSVQMITNGIRLTPALASEVKDSGVSRVSISIDGPEASHDQARGAGTWRLAWRGLEAAVSAGLSVNVISVLGRHNLDDWDVLPQRLKDAGVRSQNVSLMCRLGRAEQAEEWLGVPAERVGEVQARADRVKQALNDSNFAVFLNDGVLQSPGWSGEPTPLHAFQDRNPGIEAVVKVNGDVLRNRLYGKDRTIGNVNEQSFDDIWHQDRPQRVQISSLLGEDNVGSLPGLYHHYGDVPEKGHNGSTAASRIDTNVSKVGRDVRVREEEWGTITFDPATFAITAITARGKTSA